VLRGAGKPEDWSTGSRRYRFAQRGQAMAEFALVTPILVLLLFGVFLAAYYAYRAAAADWGVFITGVASGAYDTPATEQARRSLPWADLRARLAAGQAAPRQVRSQIAIEERRSQLLGVDFVEAERASAFFRLWRFYPGPPEGSP